MKLLLTFSSSTETYINEAHDNHTLIHVQSSPFSRVHRTFLYLFQVWEESQFLAFLLQYKFDGLGKMSALTYSPCTEGHVEHALP